MRNYLMINPVATVTNPVLTLEWAQKLAATADVARFDLHTDLEDIMRGTTPAFIADAYGSAQWWLDQQIKSALKAAARGLPKITRTLDGFSDLQNALDEAWHGEEHQYEVGYEANGPMHVVVALRSVRPMWMAHAHRANTARGYINPKGILSIETQIGTPRKQTITSAQVANFEFDALKLVGGLSDIRLRGEFRDGINMGEQLMSIERVKRDKNPGAPDEQIQMYCDQDEEFIAIEKKRNGLSSSAIRALNHRTQRIADQEAMFDRWYEDEIESIELQLAVWDYTAQFTIDEPPAFSDLPGTVQTTVLNAVTESFTKTLQRYSSKASSLYSTYSMLVDAANALIQRVIAARAETCGYEDISADNVEQIGGRIDKANSLGQRGKMM